MKHVKTTIGAIAASAIVASAFAAVILLAATPALAAETCDPTQTEPQFRGQVPKLADVVPDPGPNPDSPLPGEVDELTVDQAYRYLSAVDRASDRVISGSLGQRTWKGRKIRWAIAGRRANLSSRSLKRIARVARRLTNAKLPAGKARQIARRYPAIFWVTANVHGNEESGTEGSLRLLYELADRADCAAARILDNAIVVVVPVQNPDGRIADTRQNGYGFDPNRDRFARTQPETDAQIEMMRKLPGPVVIDAHEYISPFFFMPPYADPIYHEIPDQSIRWQEGYGGAVAAEFDRQGIDYQTRAVFDLFFVGYGDSAPSVGFNSAGITFEAGQLDFPIEGRGFQQYLAMWTTLSEAAARKRKVLKEWAAGWRDAYRQGKRGLLEPNQVFTPDNEVATEVPERRVRHYFIRNARGKRADARAVVRLLQRMDVDVYKLRKGLVVPDYTPYGRSTQRKRIPAGTWYVPMAQSQKHWVQAMLNENTYVPFPFFNDASAWSLPLLANLRGGYSGKRLKVKTSRPGSVPEQSFRVGGGGAPRIALFQLEQLGFNRGESGYWLRYLLEQVWDLPFTDVTATDIAAGALEGYDVVLIPNGRPEPPLAELGAAGQQALREWVRSGGHLISWRGGTELAARLGLTSAILTDPSSDVPGSLFRVKVKNRQARRGVGGTAYAYYEYDKVMRASSRQHVVVKFPSPNSRAWFVSGFASGAEELGGTAAVVDEPTGAGRTTAFSVEPNFRAYTPGFQKILRNLLLGGEGAVAEVSAAGSAARSKARRAAEQLRGNSSTIRLSVKPSSAGAAEAVLEGFDARYRVQRSRGRVAFLIANPRGLTADQHPFARNLPSALEGAAVETIAYRAP